MVRIEILNGVICASNLFFFALAENLRCSEEMLVQAVVQNKCYVQIRKPSENLNSVNPYLNLDSPFF
jgi:hypothetical protein